MGLQHSFPQNLLAFNRHPSLRNYKLHSRRHSSLLANTLLHGQRLAHRTRISSRHQSSRCSLCCRSNQHRHGLLGLTTTYPKAHVSNWSLETKENGHLRRLPTRIHLYCLQYCSALLHCSTKEYYKCYVGFCAFWDLE